MLKNGFNIIAFLDTSIKINFITGKIMQNTSLAI